MSSFGMLRPGLSVDPQELDLLKEYSVGLNMKSTSISGLSPFTVLSVPFSSAPLVVAALVELLPLTAVIAIVQSSTTATGPSPGDHAFLSPRQAFF